MARVTRAPRPSEQANNATPRPEDDWLARALPVEDLTGLEPPEPMLRILLACAGLTAEVVYCARLPHAPRPLYPQLEARGLEWRVGLCPDGTALLWIRGRAR